jgi:hypothetical protein
MAESLLLQGLTSNGRMRASAEYVLSASKSYATQYDVPGSVCMPNARLWHVLLPHLGTVSVLSLTSALSCAGFMTHIPLPGILLDAPATPTTKTVSGVRQLSAAAAPQRLRQSVACVQHAAIGQPGTCNQASAGDHQPG